MTRKRRGEISPALREKLRDAIAEAVRRRLRDLDVAQKDVARALSAPAVREARRAARAGLKDFEDELVSHFASGSDVRPDRIQPTLVLVETEPQKRLFRYATLQWSIPVSQGYGRRLRFLVIDGANDMLIGVIGLGDPVFALTDRDRWVGWSRSRRALRLRCVMDAFVLGAVPPYSMLLGGKLVAALATSAEVQDAFWTRYRMSRSLIRKQKQRHPLAMITTTSAFGRSSLYNRVALDGQVLWTHVGVTRGHGEFLFGGALYRRLLALVQAHAWPQARAKGWGKRKHWRNRREVVRKALGLLDMPYKLHIHGIERAIYVAPLGPRAREWLAGSEPKLTLTRRTVADLSRAALDRWVLPRAARRPEWKLFDRESLRLWGSRERQRAVR